MKFINDIDNDIKAYTRILEGGNIEEAGQCVKEIEFVYGKRVDGLNGLYRNAVWDGDVDWLGLLKNAIRIIGFYKEEYLIKEAHNQKIGVNRLSDDDVDLRLQMTVTDAIAEVLVLLEGTMSDDSYEALASNLKELEKISQLDLTIGKKWLKTRDLVEWSITKGVDVFLMVMPIVYKVLK